MKDRTADVDSGTSTGEHVGGAIADDHIEPDRGSGSHIENGTDTPDKTSPLDGSGEPEAAVVPATAHLTRRARRKQRVSKWDRPPEPHDWRFFVGHLGRILIATGMLLFLFVAYQLWGTGIETARAQNKLDDQFQELIAEQSAPDVEPIPNVVTEAGVVTDPTSDGVAFQAIPLPPPSQTIDPSSTVVPDAPYEVVVPAADQNLPVVERNLALGNIAIPSIGVDFLFVPGVTHEDLKQGIGYFPDTPLPGQLGNSALAGHRTTYKHPFGDLDKVNVGDDIVVALNNNETYTYVITGSVIVNPEDYWVISDSDPNLATLTLITCEPKATSKQRLVVFAELDPARSGPVGQATLPQLEEIARSLLPDEPPAAAPAPGVTTVAASVAQTVAPVTTIAELVGGATTLADTSATTTIAGTPATPPATTVADTTTNTIADAVPATTVAPALDTEQVAGPSGDDAFSGSWFDDTDAWPHIAGWGVLLSIIAIGAYLLSRKTRHDSIGFLAGIAPFTVCLYFFFENVNRLLPPGL